MKKGLKTLFFQFSLVSEQSFLNTKIIDINNCCIANLNNFEKTNNDQLSTNRYLKEFT